LNIQLAHRSYVALLAFAYGLAFVVWLFLFGQLQSFHWLLIASAALASAIFVSFGVAVYAAVGLVFHSLPPWLNTRRALFLIFSGLALQSCFAGIMALLGVWPAGRLWLLGVFSFLWH